jgi:type I restriction enzyme M protein
MTSTTQRAELQSQIWKIANEVRGAVDGWDFKQYVLGALFYRFIKANDYNLSVSSYVEAKDTREVIDITKLNEELKTTVAKIDTLRSDIDKIVA